MERLDQSYRAGWLRIVLVVMAVIAVPLFMPRLTKYWPALVFYGVNALGIQALIRRGIGGSNRQLLGGVADILMVSLLVHLTGSVTSVLIGCYLVIVMMLALVAGARVGRQIAALAIAVYWGVLGAEMAGLLSYAPEVPEWLGQHDPSLEARLASGFFMASLCFVTANVVGKLADQVHRREVQLVDANNRLQDQSLKDPLTDLFNRRHLVERIGVALERISSRPAALMMIDLDGFKHINDTFGHVEGDRLLIEVGQALSGAVRGTDIVGRYGGDEFIVLLSDAERADIDAVAARIVGAVRDVGTRYDPAQPVTASVGVALGRHGESVNSWLDRADENAYAAKQRGGDQQISEHVRAA